MDNWKKAKQLYRQMIDNFCFLLNNKTATKITNMQTVTKFGMGNIQAHGW